MSRESYYEAKKIILNDTEGKSDFLGNLDLELINKAEESLGLKFTGVYLEFLKEFGLGSYGGQEIFGIPDGLRHTLDERKEYSLPENLFIIHNTGSGHELFCLDFNQLNEDNEPKVVLYDPTVGLGYQTYEVIAEDFGDFLLDLIYEEDEVDEE